MTDTDLEPAPAGTRPASSRLASIALVVIALAGLVTAGASIVTAHNSTEVCESVSDGSWIGGPDPCW
jgi:hypothetical protein